MLYHLAEIAPERADGVPELLLAAVLVLGLVGVLALAMVLTGVAVRRRRNGRSGRWHG